MITVEQLQQDKEIQAWLHIAEKQLHVMGFTLHGERHRLTVCGRVEEILRASGMSEHDIELGKVAGYLHDIGCSINRQDHAHSSALLVAPMLKERGLSAEDISVICNAIGNHDERSGYACTPVSAALILADKSDVHRKRVQREKLDENRQLINIESIHDRVNYSVIHSVIEIDGEHKIIMFKFKLDSATASISDYFEIFLGRMRMCQEAANILGLTFHLEINDQILT